MRLITLLFIFVLLSSCSRSPAYRFIDNYNQQSNTISATIPGWLVRTGMRAAFKDYSDEDDVKGFAAIAKKLGEIRVFTAKNGVVPTDGIRKLILDSKDSDYEEYVTARDKGKIVNVMVRQDDDTVKNILIIVSSEEEVVVAHMDSEIQIHELEKASISWNKHRKPKESTHSQL